MSQTKPTSISVFLDNENSESLFDAVLERYISGMSDKEIIVSVICTLKLDCSAVGEINNILYMIKHSDYATTRMSEREMTESDELRYQIIMLIYGDSLAHKGLSEEYIEETMLSLTGNYSTSKSAMSADKELNERVEQILARLSEDEDNSDDDPELERLMEESFKNSFDEMFGIKPTDDDDDDDDDDDEDEEYSNDGLREIIGDDADRDYDVDEDDEEEMGKICVESISLFADNNRATKEFEGETSVLRISLKDNNIHASIRTSCLDEKIDDAPIVYVVIKNESNGRSSRSFVTLDAPYVYTHAPAYSLFPDNDYRTEQIISVSVYADSDIEDGTATIYRRSFLAYYADSPLDMIKINRVGMYYATADSDFYGVNCALNYMSFLKSNLEQMSLLVWFNQKQGVKLDKVLPYAYLYDQTGRLLEKVYATMNEDHLGSDYAAFFAFGRFCDYKWSEGRYRYDVVMLGRTIAAGSFTVGGFEQEGEVDINQMTSMIRSNLTGEFATQSLENRLDSLIGLKKVKEQLANLGKVSNLSNLRKAQGLPSTDSFLHATFVGSPGTGKTTVAHIVGQIYKSYGLLSRGHVVTVDRKSLVGRYYDSELKAVEQAVNSAQGGVLFIDEAYNLYVEDDPKDPGHKIIETLLTYLSDSNYKDWMLVLAGYPKEIDKLINSNPGLKSRIAQRFIFDDYDVDELMQIAELYCRDHFYIMDDQVRTHLRSVIQRDYSSRDDKFGNARYVISLFENTIVPNMARRLSSIDNPSARQLQKIESVDIPSMHNYKESRAMNALKDMVGLANLKDSIALHLNFVKMTNLRIQKGMHTSMPPLHMVFTGNPGTGKTTVADFMGEIYASMGILSNGDVIRVEKADLIGQRVGETESKTKAVLSRAKGNILFIDEAYQLAPHNGAGEEGRIVVETLLTALSNDHLDTIVILAGYPEDMENLLSINSGLRSRFPYTFHFEDYSVDELVNIAIRKAAEEEFVFSKAALVRLRALIKSEVMRKKPSFGNARYVTRLISTRILPNMATRLSNMNQEPSRRQLRNIVAEDIPISEADAKRIESGGFDEAAIDRALARLDSLVGLRKVKTAIHNFVTVARYRNSQGERFVGKGLLKWNFVGSTGTGKSTVAEILADILRAMNLLDKGNLVEVKGEQIYYTSPVNCDNVLRNAMESARYGMLFIDGDAPEFRTDGFRMTNEQLRISLTSLTAQTGGPGALVIAECISPRQAMAGALAHSGVYDFDHTFVFDDYTDSELFDILCQCLAKHKARFSEAAEVKMREYIRDLCSNRELSFANARTMKLLSRTIYDKMLLRQSSDTSSPKGLIQLGDVESYVWHKPYSKIGY